MVFNFKRYEKKYLVTNQQTANVITALKERMVPDEYGTYWVQNLYFDTDNWDVIRKSMEKPLYKEKLRLRCYGEPDGDGNFFVELKKKYTGVVYKRRIALPISAVKELLPNVKAKDDQQIARELAFYLESNPVESRMYIAFKRTAFAGTDGEWLRVTFDTDIVYRQHDLDFSSPNVGQPVLPDGYQLMEIKTHTSIPLWLSRILSENGIYRISYSKYGTCFTDSCNRSAKTLTSSVADSA
ncbi:MAG: polyphosphate polymerase domain-containing protein [Defluviitaleaceae bacterium]|nr:polyphosphate polymerase domain-containing protein [Defluviitaleaceae bacterium]